MSLRDQISRILWAPRGATYTEMTDAVSALTLAAVREAFLAGYGCGNLPVNVEDRADAYANNIVGRAND